MKNRLIEEDSLYLRQHATQPVAWYAWGDEAFKAAKAEDKPLLVSIGYSACHWCHVMAHESFDDPFIAKLMNEHFICVKVDREERPDVDQVYMEAVQMIQKQGGWPLNVFCLPDGRPFFGGTYFPPEDKGNGMIPWPQLVMRIADFYKRSKGELIENAESIEKNIQASNEVSVAEGEKSLFQPQALEDAARGLVGNHDDQYGGFGQAPKFPPSMSLNFLRALAPENDDLAKRINQVSDKTLKAMAHGGIYDQFGGGFARYSVDTHWLIPHFEKMLYDNAFLIEAYTRGWMGSNEPIYSAVVEETISWLEREMSSKTGGFFAALDADSEGEEGRYYVWEPEEVDEVLGLALGREVRMAYNITPQGNFEHGTTNPALVESDFETRAKLAGAREQLRQHREANRVAPGRDEKIHTAWNCMLLRALADAAFYFGRQDWMERAIQLADFVVEQLIHKDEVGVSVRAVYYEDRGARIDGFLHDYALAADALFTLAGKVDWYREGLSQRYREYAFGLVDAALTKFNDSEFAGFFFTAEGVETPVARRKEWFDNATPSGNSVMLHALSAAYTLSGESRYLDAFQSTLSGYTDYAQKVASGVAHGLEAAASQQRGIAIIKVSAPAKLSELQGALAGRAWRRTIIQLVESQEPSATYQLCVGTHCQRPTDSIDELVSGL